MADNQNNNNSNQTPSTTTESQKGTIKFSTKLVKDSADLTKLNCEKRIEKK